MARNKILFYGSVLFSFFLLSSCAHKTLSYNLESPGKAEIENIIEQKERYEKTLFNKKLDLLKDQLDLCIAKSNDLKKKYALTENYELNLNVYAYCTNEIKYCFINKLELLQLEGKIDTVINLIKEIPQNFEEFDKCLYDLSNLIEKSKE